MPSRRRSRPTSSRWRRRRRSTASTSRAGCTCCSRSSGASAWWRSRCSTTTRSSSTSRLGWPRWRSSTASRCAPTRSAAARRAAAASDACTATTWSRPSCRLADVAETQRAAAERRHPDVDELEHIATTRSGLWERRPGDGDFLAVRAGRAPVAHVGRPHLDLGNNPLTEYEPALVEQARNLAARWSTIEDVPVAIGLTAAPVLSIVGAPAAGARERARACSRSSPSRTPRPTCASPSRTPARRTHGSGASGCRTRAARPPAAPPPRARRWPATPRSSLPCSRSSSRRASTACGCSPTPPRGETVEPLDAPWLVLVLDAFSPRDARARLPLLREALACPTALRVIVICLVEDLRDEPAETGARLRLAPRGCATLEETGPDGHVQEDVVYDEADPGEAEAVARALAPVRLREGAIVAGLDVRDGLLSLLGLPDVDALDPHAEWRGRPRALAMQATIGVGEDGQRLVLDLKQAAEGGMGPHGLIIGATGSGKSELLRTLIMSLALAHPPEELAFVFVDFKGGAAFADLETLPHTAGMITNLQSDLSMVDRMHDALHGEQERRQRILRDAGNVDDVIAYRRLREQRPSLAPLPDLLVVIDEFGELLASRPEYIDLFVAIGRVGRSLGIHLLFSSQRFDEGRLRGLESHLRYRICLRTFSADDSRGVLGTPDAYLLPSQPGLGYLKVDTEVYERFQATLVRQPRTPRPGAAAAADPRLRRRWRAGDGRRAPRRGRRGRRRPAPDRPAAARRPRRRRRAPGLVRAAGCVDRARCAPGAGAVLGATCADDGVAGDDRDRRCSPAAAHRAARARACRHDRACGDRRRAAVGQEHAAAHAGRRAGPRPYARGARDLRDRPRRRAAAGAGGPAARRRGRRQGGPRARAPDHRSPADRARRARGGLPSPGPGQHGRPARAPRGRRAGAVRRDRAVRRRLGAAAPRPRGRRCRDRRAAGRRADLRPARDRQRQPLGRDAREHDRRPRLAPGAAPQRPARLAGRPQARGEDPGRHAGARPDARGPRVPGGAAAAGRDRRGRRSRGGERRCARADRRALGRPARVRGPRAATTRRARGAAAAAASGRADRRRGGAPGDRRHRPDRQRRAPADPRRRRERPDERPARARRGPRGLLGGPRLCGHGVRHPPHAGRRRRPVARRLRRQPRGHARGGRRAQAGAGGARAGDDAGLDACGRAGAVPRRRRLRPARRRGEPAARARRRAAAWARPELPPRARAPRRRHDPRLLRDGRAGAARAARARPDPQRRPLGGRADGRHPRERAAARPRAARAPRQLAARADRARTAAHPLAQRRAPARRAARRARHGTGDDARPRHQQPIGEDVR